MNATQGACSVPYLSKIIQLEYYKHNWLSWQGQVRTRDCWIRAETAPQNPEWLATLVIYSRIPLQQIPLQQNVCHNEDFPISRQLPIESNKKKVSS